MSQSTARRCAAILVVVTASFLLPVSSAHAAPRGGGRGEGGFLARVELRNMASSVWATLTSLFGKVGARMDDNG